MYRHLDLFSGIGGFALAARRVGFETIQFVEIDEWCQRVLRKNFPGVPIHDDVETYTAPEGSADIITAGWPCQDISLAGEGAGLDGARSGLWKDVARLVRDVRPRWVVLENVSALLSRGLDRVAGELAEIGYDAEWHCIPATAVGAPHLRDRIWIIAYPFGCGLRIESGRQQRPNGEGETVAADDGATGTLADADGGRQPVIGVEKYGELESESRRFADGCSSPGRGSRETVADAGGARRQARLSRSNLWQERDTGVSVNLGDELRRTEAGAGMEWWSAEPGVGRVADGIPDRVHRLRGLGNAVVPQIPEAIFNSLKTTP